MARQRRLKGTPHRAAAGPPAAQGAPPHSAEELLQELRVHQIELEMQNEALRQAQAVLEESRDRYVSLFDFAPVGYLTLSRDGVIVEANLMATRLLGTVRPAVGSRRFESFVAPADLERWRRYFISIWKGAVDETSGVELNLLRQDNASFPAELQCAVKTVPAGAPVLRIAFTDISERKALEQEQRIAAIAFESQEGMMVTDASGIILRVNSAFTALSGYSADEAIGSTAALLSSGRHDPGFYQRLWQTLEAQRYWQGEIWERRKDGSLYVAWLTISAVTTPAGDVSHYVGTFSDTTAKSEAAAEIHRLAFYDPLTALPNRRLLQDRLSHALATGARSGLYGAILFLDLDNFKTLNDTRGHDIGDLLLVAVAERVRGCLREGDTVARLGGDEFVMIVEGLSAQAEEAAVLVQQIGEKLNQTIAQPFDLGGTEFHCTTSIGARLMSGRDTVDELLKHADLALYQAKADGRNTVRFYDPSMQAALDHRSLLEGELRQALKLDQFRLHYQPQFDDADRIFGAEILLRWRHPSGVLVSPGDFIPVTEQSELILPIGRWVLETACEQLALWSRGEGTRGLKLAVNVSARQFRQPDFIDQVRHALERSEANPDRLTLELTETMVLDNVAETIRKMHAIRQLGVRFSIDDFGTGFSSFAYLTRLLLDQIKIDRSFVLRLPDHSADAIIVSAIIGMAGSLGLNVLAEGVETEAQREFLLARGCHAYQGYLFGGPLPLADFEALVSAGGRARSEVASSFG